MDIENVQFASISDYYYNNQSAFHTLTLYQYCSIYQIKIIRVARNPSSLIELAEFNEFSLNQLMYYLYNKLLLHEN